MREEILKTISGKVGQELTMDTKVADMDIDSLDLMTYIFEIEEQYGIELDQDQLTEMNTIEDLVNSIAQKVEQGA